MKIIAIIPARYASSRLPGKPLVDIGGKTMIQRTYEQVKKAIGTVLVATDDRRIYEKIKEFGGEVVMTSPNHNTGTERCFEAAQKANKLYNTNFEVVLNIQGDEPFIAPEMIKMLMKCFDNPKTEIATLIKPIENEEDLFNPNRPKVIFNTNKEAIYFSRSTIPYFQKAEKNQWLKKHDYFMHIGIYGFQFDILKQIIQLSPSLLQKAESLEQNCWLENGYKIKIDITKHESLSIDTPEDLDNIRKNIM